jgi:hypothetical protein
MNIKSLILGLALVTGYSGIARADLIINGSFESSGYTPGVTQPITNPGVPPNDHGKITGWSVSGAGSTSNFWNAVYIYDNPIAGAAPNPMPASYRTCAPSAGFQAGAQCSNPDGPGYFVNLDGDPGFPTAISQTIAPTLLNGKTYRLTFNWSAVERIDASGPTSDEFLTVSLGNILQFDTQNYFPGPSSGPIPPNCPLPTCLPSQGFSGWFTTVFDFQGDGSANNILSFLANGNPSGIPPTVNLDGVSLVMLPEPSSWVIATTGIGLMAAMRRRRQASKTV